MLRTVVDTGLPIISAPERVVVKAGVLPCRHCVRVTVGPEDDEVLTEDALLGVEMLLDVEMLEVDILLEVDTLLDTDVLLLEEEEAGIPIRIVSAAPLFPVTRLV